jgi:catechol 2,3-dioxygenase-like lactoylglutathione lyase family enzyme
MFWTRRIFRSAGDVAVDVHDVAAAQRWYSEKLGLPYSSSEVEEASMELGYSHDEVVVYLVEMSGSDRPNRNPQRPSIIFVKKVAGAHEFLRSRGVNAGPIQSDSGGNQFFRFHDLEDNELEVCQEP